MDCGIEIRRNVRSQCLLLLIPLGTQKGLSGDLKDVLRLHIQGEGFPSLIPEGMWHSSQLSSGLKETSLLALLRSALFLSGLW